MQAFNIMRVFLVALEFLEFLVSPPGLMVSGWLGAYILTQALGCNLWTVALLPIAVFMQLAIVLEDR
ncbi:MAG: hypothetical protein Kow00121_48820 [Elainellaceae cyanobacterium]